MFDQPKLMGVAFPGDARHCKDEVQFCGTAPEFLLEATTNRGYRVGRTGGKARREYSIRDHVRVDRVGTVVIQSEPRNVCTNLDTPAAPLKYMDHASFGEFGLVCRRAQFPCLHLADGTKQREPASLARFDPKARVSKGVLSGTIQIAEGGRQSAISVEPLAWGDFDGDSLDDVIVFVSNAMNGGSTLRTRVLVLTRSKASDVLRVVTEQ